MQVGWASRENRTVYQRLNLVRLDTVVLQQVVDATVGGDDGIEYAGVRVGIELDQQVGFGHCSLAARKKAHCRSNGQGFVSSARTVAVG